MQRPAVDLSRTSAPIGRGDQNRTRSLRELTLQSWLEPCVSILDALVAFTLERKKAGKIVGANSLETCKD